MELLVKPEMLTSYTYGPTFGNAETVSFYLLHNVSILNQCREVSCVTFVLSTWGILPVEKPIVALLVNTFMTLIGVLKSHSHVRMKVAYIFLQHFFKTHVNITPPPPKSSKWSFSFIFSHRKQYKLSHLFHACCIPRRSQLP